MLEPGGRIGKYTLGARLGRGGAGEVWSAKDGELGRAVALKFVHGEDREELARFEREARAAAGLAHPGIAAVYEVGTFDGRPFIAMQLVDGGTLRSRAGDPREAARCIRDAARALQHAHDHGVIHRDLKPDNLLVGADGRVFVTDFGLARLSASGSTLTAQGAVIGTPAYMPPEQARGDVARVDAKSDIYSLGATLHHLLTGLPPFSGATVYEVISNVVNRDPATPASDPPLAAITLKCMRKDPAGRYESMTALADDLERWLSGQPVSATLPSLRQRMARRRGTLAAAVVIAAALMAGVVVAWRARSVGEAATAMTVASLRQRADVCFRAAIDLRRAGNLAGMEKYEEELAAACAAFAAAEPGSPEPHHLRGRMLRARLQFIPAEQAQERALALDPGHARARYERLLLLAHRQRRELDDLWNEGLLRYAALPPDAPRTVKFEVPAAIVKRRELITSDAGALSSDASLESGERHGARALGAWAADRIEEARAAAREALAAGAEFDEIYLLLGDCERALGRVEEAIAAYAAGLAKDAGALMLRVALAGARYALAGTVEEFTEIERELERSLAVDPSNRPARRLRANVAMERARRFDDSVEAWKVAEARYEEALRLQPDDVSVLTGMALARANGATRVLRSGGDPREAFRAAEEMVTRAIASDGRYAAAWNARGLARMNHAVWQAERGEPVTDRFEAAAADFTQAIALDPGEARFVEWRAKARMNLGLQGARYGEHFASAVMDLVKAEAIGGGEGARTTRGLVLYNWGRREAAAGVDPAARYREALEALGDAQGAEGRFVRGLVRVALGNPREAIDDFTASLGVQGSRDEAWAHRGRARGEIAAEAGKRGEDAEALFREAVEDGEKACRLNERHAESWFALAMTRRLWGTWRMRSQGDPREPFRGAIEAFSRTLVLQPGYVAAHVNRGSTRHALGRAMEARRESPVSEYRGAMEDYRRAVELDAAHEAKLASVMEICRRDQERVEK